MKPNPSNHAIKGVILYWLIFLAILMTNTASAAPEFQLIKTMGNKGGTSLAELIQDSTGNFYGTTASGGIGAGTVFKIDSSGNFSVLHEFDGAGGGSSPEAGLMLASDGFFYGTTRYGGSSGAGTIFKIDSSGEFSVLHEFAGASGGSGPSAGLIEGSDGSLYGTTGRGGNNDYGTVFKLDTSGNFNVLHHFNDSDGSNPVSELLLADSGSFYGTTTGGGNDGRGVIFILDSSGNFSVLHHFNNSEGAGPWGSLIQGSDGSFYGTTSYGISDVYGTVFKLDASGNLTVLASFSGNNGSAPLSGVVQGSDGSFYGTTVSGGVNNLGTVFKLDPEGNLSLLHEFSGSSDGSGPWAGLIRGADGSLYGTTPAGGSDGTGTVYKIDLSGNFSNLYSFEGIVDGSNPTSLIQANDGNFYGTTLRGGEYGFGTAFRLDGDDNVNVLHSFDGENDGPYPSGIVQASDGSFYGTTTGGYLDDILIEYGYGTLFNIDSSENFSKLYTFDGSDGLNVGSNANAGLIQGSDGNFYGTTPYGGSGAGTVFKRDSAGNISILHEFDGGSGGANPLTGVIQASDGNFYGTTSGGGNENGEGIIFKLTPTGEFSVLHTFNGTSDGKSSMSPLLQGLDGNFYGITSFGEAHDAGTVFKLEPNGNYSVLHVFDDSSYGDWSSSLIQAHNGKLYGTRPFGGENNVGVVFELDLSGNYIILHSFKGNDGERPRGLLQASDGNIYGFTFGGGFTGSGTLFRLVENAAPIAQAGADQTANAGSWVTLNGSTSSDPDNGPSPLTYQWAQTGGPSVPLKGSTTAQPSFTPLEPGTYVFSLVVNDGEDSSTADSVTVTVNDADYVLIQSPNGGEVWNEKSKQTITWISRHLDSKLRLVLSLSTDNGQTWSKIASPKNSGLKAWKVPKNRYVSKEALFKVCVKQDESLCDVSDAVFTINKAPKAEAGKNQKATAGSEVHLDGSASVDADNGPSPLTYRWTQISGPAVTLNGADTATLSFTPTVKGVYKFSLIVNDGAIDSKADKVAVRVLNAP